MSWRLFVALPIPEPVRRSLRNWIRELDRDSAGWRFADLQRVHLTLRFLGETEPERAKRVVEAFRSWEPGVQRFGLTIAGCGVFPTTARARILWAGVAGDERSLADLERLAWSAEDWARGNGYPEERRPFRPHITLARARRARAKPPREVVGETRQPAFGELPVETVALYRSHLGSNPVLHERLITVSLSGQEAS